MREIEDCKWKILPRKRRNGEWYDSVWKARPCDVISYDNAGDRLNKTVGVSLKILDEGQLKTEQPDDSVSYDRVGNRLSMTDHNGKITKYTYDNLYRLTKVEYGNGNIEEFSYDNVGNRLTRTLNGTVTNYSYNAGNRLLTEVKNGATISYSYDNNGNMISKDGLYGVDNYSYNYENGLINATTAEGDVLSFGYDPSGIRTYKIHSGTRTNFLIDDQSVIADYNGTGILQAKYALGGVVDEIISMAPSGGGGGDDDTKYYLYDGIGSVVNIISATQQVLNSYAYEAFGNFLVKSEQAANRYTFQAREWESALKAYYHRARYFDPSLGRALTQDPFRGDYTNPPSLNRYITFLSNPQRYTDPSGENPIWLIAILASIGINAAILLLLFPETGDKYISYFLNLITFAWGKFANAFTTFKRIWAMDISGACKAILTFIYVLTLLVDAAFAAVTYLGSLGVLFIIYSIVHATFFTWVVNLLINEFKTSRHCKK